MRKNCLLLTCCAFSVIVNGQYVGVGTTTPTSGLEVKGTGLGSQQRITDPTSGNTLVLQSGNGENLKVTGFNYGTFTARPLYLSVDGASTYINPNGGNVGIGTIAPTGGYLLDVAGPVKSVGNTTHFVAQTNGGTNSWARFYMRSPSQSWFMGTSQNFIGNQFYIGDETFNHTRFSIQPNNGLIFLSTATGVGINTSNTTGYALAVNGNIRSKEIIVETGWADYVFENDYYLMPLPEIEAFIKKYKHLPNIPPAREVEEKGLPIGNMQKRMMEKIEELTLHIIQLKKELDELKIHQSK
jgi:hypothetical protein